MNVYMDKLVYCQKKKKRGTEDPQLAWLWLQHCGQRPMEVPPAMPGTVGGWKMIHTQPSGGARNSCCSLSALQCTKLFPFTKRILSSLNYLPRKQTKWTVFQIFTDEETEVLQGQTPSNPMSGMGERTLITPYLANLATTALLWLKCTPLYL